VINNVNIEDKNENLIEKKTIKFLNFHESGNTTTFQNSSTASHAECRFCRTLILANGIFAEWDLKANVKRKYRIAQKWQIELQNGK
jgi:hypothetical protein